MPSKMREPSGRLSDKPISQQAAELQSKLSASGGQVTAENQEALLDFFDNLLERPQDQNESTLESLIEEAVEAVRRFVRRNLELDFDPQAVTWRDPDSDQPYDDMRNRVGNVRVVGELWGMSPLTHPLKAGALLVTDVGDRSIGGRVKWVDEAAKNAVRCQLGATFGDVFEFLKNDPANMRLANQPGFSGLTVAGVVGTGGHGSGLRFGPLASLVSRIELADVAGGGGRKEFLRGGPDFELAVTHLGRLGPVRSIDLDVRKGFHIAETRSIHHIPKDGLPTLIQEAIDEQRDDDGLHSIEIWVTPYADGDGHHTVAYGRRRFTDAPAMGKRPISLRSKMLQGISRFLVSMVSFFNPAWVKPILHYALERTEEKTPVIMDAHDGLDFGAPNRAPMTSMELAVPLDRGGDAVKLLLETLQDLSANQDLYVFAPLGMRFVGQGASTGISPQAGNARTLHLEVPTFRGDTLRGAQTLARAQQTMARSIVKARPHWGQRVDLDAPTLASLWDKKSRDAVRAHVAKLDPNGVFASPLLDDMLKHD